MKLRVSELAGGRTQGGQPVWDKTTSSSTSTSTSHQLRISTTTTTTVNYYYRLIREVIIPNMQHTPEKCTPTQFRPALGSAGSASTFTNLEISMAVATDSCINPVLRLYQVLRFVPRQGCGARLASYQGERAASSRYMLILC
ncbi:hypothetical protein TESG_08319 [Trichophyton tonsurans CBS 112818]|uniref:Uncharacterized protein n=1 Tax=Trichophyton tonsurans (strain CBS 112818) TaxID=647933 RepID=F2RS92_TRIT1|nr:hypothetical protein TESG_08319 [Trichophyton tonsurans CBS 112818]